MKTILILFFLFVSSLVIAGELELTYSEGTIYQKKGRKWVELVTGDLVRDNATIRVGVDSFAEFEGEINGENIFLSIIDEGTYILKDFVASSQDFQDSGFLSMITSKVDYLLSNSSSTREAALGARGKDQNEGEMEWEGAEKYLIKGIEELEKGDIHRALKSLEESFNQATEEEKPEIYYYTALANYQKGLKTKALKILEKATPKQDDYYYINYALLLGSLYLYSRNYEKAIYVLEPLKEKKLEIKDKQNFYLIQGISLLKMGRDKEAKISLVKAKEIDPYSMPGKTAVNFLEKL